MRVLGFDVKGQKITKSPECDFSGLVRGTAGYLRARFTFDKEWDGCKKVAAFFDHKGREHACPIVNGECDIQPGVTRGEKFEVAVIGAKGEQRIRSGRLTIRQGR